MHFASFLSYPNNCRLQRQRRTTKNEHRTHPHSTHTSSNVQKKIGEEISFGATLNETVFAGCYGHLSSVDMETWAYGRYRSCPEAISLLI